MSTPKPRFFLGSKRGGGTTTTNAASSSSSRTPASSSRATPGGSKPPPPPPDAPILNPDGDRRLTEVSNPDDVCPVCRNDRYLNPKLRLMVSKCYHKMCESCLDRLFSLGPEPCPVCGQTIRKNQFQPQIFENLEVQKEVAVRKRTAKIFNKRPEDFSSLEAYNDYLEEYESITFSLIHSIGSDLATTEAKIRSYELQNRASIEDNEERLARERDELERRERGEREWREGERRRFLEEEQRREREREEERKRIVEELGTSNASAAQILALHRKRSTARNFSPPSGGSSASEVDPSLKLKFLSNLASSSSSAPKDSPAPEPSYDPLLDPLSDLTLYLPLPSSLPPLSLLPRRSLAPPGTKTYDPSLGTLVREAARDDSGGFSADEVWEKAVRVGMAGLGDAPVGWGGKDV
ncbi:CDK-activating kinase assembly factor MAT1-domain-containing protein [Rhodotorula diobovata]|uniref:RNA polymerase II transcription factor B subunit 3 n=1 Tax=Rhodotorula diobovata TaxID=5288 RepID=A0A5C5FXU2_9BASI|nr:CDK-activating kinase assembly factor MAT1-domain-containing protein [Rhodotorula diobovata]